MEGRVKGRDRRGSGKGKGGEAWYGIVGFNVPLDTL